MTAVAVYILVYVIPLVLNTCADTRCRRKGMRRWPNRVLLGCALLMYACTWVQCVVQAMVQVGVQNALNVAVNNLQSPALPPTADLGQYHTNGANVASTLALVINVGVCLIPLV